MNKKLFLNTLRSLKSTKSRFFAILAIIAIGSGFFAGVKSAGPDMKLSSAKYLDEQGLADIHILSTLGFDDEDLATIENAASADEIYAGYSAEFVVSGGDLDGKIIKAYSYDPKSGINLPYLVEGRLPEKPDEIIADERFFSAVTPNVGDKIVLKSGDDNDTSDYLSNTEFTVVGKAKFPVYIAYERGNASIGNGVINGWLLIPEENFSYEIYTDIYISLEEADGVDPYSEKYDEIVDKNIKILEKLGETQIEHRKGVVLDEAYEEINDAKEELADGEKELADGEKDLADAEQKVADGEAEIADNLIKLEDAEKEIADGEAEIAENVTKLEDAEKEIADGEAEIAENVTKLEDAEKEIADGESEIAENVKKLQDAEKEISDGEAEIAENVKKLQDAEKEIADGESEIAENVKKLQDAEKEISDGEAEIAENVKKLEDAEKEIADGEAEIAENEKKLEDAEKEIKDGEDEIARNEKKLEDAGKEIIDGEKKIVENAARLEAAEKEIADGEAELENAEAEYNDGLKAVAALKSKVDILNNTLITYRSNVAYDVSVVSELIASLNEGGIFTVDGTLEQCLYAYMMTPAEYDDGTKTMAGQGIAGYAAGLSSQAKELENTLAESKIKLDSAKAVIEASKAEVAAGWAEIEKGKAELEYAKTKFTDGWEQIQDAKAKLAPAKKEIADGRKELEKAKAEIEDAKAEIADGWAELEKGKAELEDAKAEVADGWAEIEKGRAEIEDAKAEVADGWAELEKGRAELEDAKAEVADGWAELEDGKKELEDAKNEVADGWAELEDGKKELEDAKTEVADGWAELEDGKKELEDAKNEVADGWAEIEDALTELEDGKKEIEDAKIEIADGKKEIEDAKQEIADAEKEVHDAVDDAEWYVFDREYNPYYSHYAEDCERVDAIAAVFPIFFILVAALVCCTTMTRMVEEQRTEIGTLKALGYSRLTIISQYIIYAVAASVPGGFLGLLIGFATLPRIIFVCYQSMYSQPYIIVPFRWDYAIGCIIAACLCTGLSALYASRQELVSVPAQLMRPKPPKDGKRILLERIGFIWKHLKFTTKVTFRNLFRYKARLLMTVIGIAGCTALLLTGFGLRESITQIVDRQYGDIFKYDAIVAVNDSDETDYAAISEDCSSSGLVSKQMPAMQITEDIHNADGNSYETYLFVPEAADNFESFIDLHTRTEKEPIGISDGVVIGEKLARLLGVSAGDKVYFGESSVPVTVDAVCENYTFNYSYMTKETYQKLGIDDYSSNIFLLNMTDTERADDLSEVLLKNDDILAVTYSEDGGDKFRDLVDSLSLIVVAIIVSAGALAFVVLFNLSNINVNERIRELATIKVLGFFDGEVAAYIYRESIASTVMGTAAGLVMGIFLEKFVVKTAEVDAVMFAPGIPLYCFAAAAVLTLVFALLVNVTLYFRLKKIDMATSLKAIE